MKILLLGHGGHGKDYCAEIIARNTGMKFESSSWEAFDAIKPVLKEIFPNETDLELYENRRVHRELWRKLILLYNTPDRSALVRKILAHNDMYVGMRSLEEFEASHELFDQIYWIDAGERLGYDDPSMEIPYDRKRMILIDNNGSKQKLAATLSWGFAAWSH